MWNNHPPFAQLTSMNEYYYLNHRNTPQGPHCLAELAQLMADGRLNPTTLVACKGAATWEALGTVLSRENIETPAATPVSSGKLGNCPRCQNELPGLNAEGQLPASCPRCMRSLRPNKPGIWANFCLAIRNYFEFTGRATRAEYWSLTLVTLLGYIVFLGLMMLGFSIFLGELLSGEGGDALIKKLDDNKSYAESFYLVSQEGREMLLGFCIIFVSMLLGIAWFFFTLVPGISAVCRRLHDIGKSAWWFGLGAIASFIMPAFTLPMSLSSNTFISSLAKLLDFGMFVYTLLIIAFTLMDSQRGANKYGPSAKYPQG